MPILWIEFFGAAHLEKAFWCIALMTAPVWLLMLFFGQTKIVQMIASPFVAPPLFTFALFFLLWKSYEAAVLPDSVSSIDYDGARQLLRHPIAFLALFCNLQILNLAAGTMIYQKGIRASIRVHVELLCCWVFGAPVLLIFGLRLLFQRKGLY